MTTRVFAAIALAAANAQSKLQLKVHTGVGVNGNHLRHPSHPDHLFGLAVLKEALPSAKIIALPALS